MRGPDEMRIETPEQIGVDLELAGLGSRFVAQVLDWLWKVLLTLLVLVVLVLVMSVFTLWKDVDDVPTVVQAALVVGLYALWLGWGIYFEVRRNGQTPGKRTAGIRAIRQGGAAIDFRASAIRNLLAVADFLPAFFLLGAVLVLLTKKRQRLGDLAAGTVVIRERAADPFHADIDDPLAGASDDYSFTRGQLEKVTDGERNVLRSFLQRYGTMDPESRRRLAWSLVDKFVAKTGYPADEKIRSNSDARAFLASLLRDSLENAKNR